ncbi:hypothetical protein VM95_37190 [Streptomyces rubellomurinus]|uniref:Uncharacterized protein n=1 Tax=Streptomyces rubellomurinus (strain ATCC 31215) TaxID=359131 RepID=A0A0F2T7X6_STRR3|nr:hypothetical protein VM95_37190 [Streptomyces rubellomurinus]
MHVVRLTLHQVASTGSEEADAHTAHDALWAHAEPRHGLEHVRARAGPHGIDLVLFLRAGSRSDAAVRACELLGSAARSQISSRYIMPPLGR